MCKNRFLVDYWIKGVIGRGRLGKRVLEWISEEHNWSKRKC